MSVVEHSGIVKKIYDDALDVEITVNSACDGCHLKGACRGDSESDNRVVNIKDKLAKNYVVGEKITISLAEKYGFKVVFMAYINPLIICVLTLVVMIKMGAPEPFSALISLVMIIIYFIILYIFRHEIKAKIDIKIRK